VRFEREVLLMADVTIKIFRNGPYVIQGPVQLVDHSGAEYPVDAHKAIALCRCGESAKRPFCDGTHARCGFTSEETVS
jgi:CDGSH-type Zn-finger protein